MGREELLLVELGGNGALSGLLLVEGCDTDLLPEDIKHVLGLAEVDDVKQTPHVDLLVLNDATNVGNMSVVSVHWNCFLGGLERSGQLGGDDRT